MMADDDFYPPILIKSQKVLIFALPPKLNAIMNTISTIEDVNNFFCYLYTNRKLAFHPDDCFCDYVDYETGRPSFTVEECEKYDHMMSECFDVCESSNTNVYEVATNVFDKLFR